MEQVNFKVSHQSIICDRSSLVSDTQKVYECVFEFDEEWNGYQKWAVFKQKDQAYKVLLNNDTCLMPDEAVVNQGYTQIGVYGLLGDKRYPTIWTSPVLVKLGCIDGIYPPEPTPSEWEQALEYMAKIDNFETYIPEGTSEENQLITEEILDEKGFVIDNDYVHTDNNFTNGEKEKLAVLENYDDTALSQRISQLDISKQDNITDLQNIREGAELGATAVQPSAISDMATKTWVGQQGYQNSTQVESAITSKGYATETYVNNHHDSTKANQTDLDTLEGRVDDVQELIPNDASSTNQLADKGFVNSSIATQTACFQGTYDVVNDLGLTYNATHSQVETALESIVGTKTNNDYVFVFFTNPTTSVIERYERYKFTSDDNSWNFEYELNNSSFTAQQWNAINSGITSLLVAQITTNKTDIASINSILSALSGRVGTNETNISNLQTAIGNVYTKAQTYSKTEVDIALGGKENTSNKTTSISSSSTNTQYPSAKAVYDYIRSLDGNGVAY